MKTRKTQMKDGKMKFRKRAMMLLMALLCFSAIPLKAQTWTPSVDTYTLTSAGWGNYFRVNGGGWYSTIGGFTMNTSNRDITINVSNNRSGSWWSGYTYYPVLMKSIKVMSGETEVAKLEYTEGMSQLPDGWTPSAQLSVNGDGDLFFDETRNATLTISSSLLTGYNNLTIVIDIHNAIVSRMITLWNIITYLPDAVNGIVVDGRERLSNKQ